jgi:Na+-transporting NADH:ubiquinone oxidoreductase subunit C
MNSRLYTVLYSAAIGLVCALLLTGAGRFTRPYREANEKADEVRNILRVLEVRFEEGASSEELLTLFAKVVKKDSRGSLAVYTYSDPASGAVQAVAVPFAGPGLWGPVEGLLALEPDMTTIRGVTFYKQEETPGLGGEIGSAWFQQQFKGKSIVAGSKPGIRIIRGGAKSAPDAVDAITGATMTCEKVQAMLNRTIAQIVEEYHRGR